MIKLIVGNKGSGKTKTLIDMINKAAKTTSGNIVCIEKGLKMTYDIDYSVRLIDIESYSVEGFDAFYGFIAGICAGNYDITHVFIDNLCKTVGQDISKDTETFLNWLDAFGEKNNVKFTVTISADVSSATDGMQKFL